MRLSQFLRPIADFQYSINIEYDLNDAKKVASYIPTSSAIEFLDEIILSTQDKAIKRSRILIGAYGKEKSHLTLALLAMLAGKDKKLFSRILRKAKDIDKSEKYYVNLNNYIESKKKLLPVILTAQSAELRTTVLQSLNRALKANGLSSLMPTTYFDAAIDKILSWKLNYAETYILFESKINSTGDKFIEELKKYNQEKYNLFTAIFPQITAGSEFNPLFGNDVIKVLESVVKAIKTEGYSGLFLVYDEFSKFLDGEKEAGSEANVTLLQNIGEWCDRSEEKQVHMLLISHKNIENYVGGLAKSSISKWKAISNRFKAMSIESSDAEIFEMMSEVLSKDEKQYRIFLSESAGKMAALKNLTINENDNRVIYRPPFSEMVKHVGLDFTQRCYPLHPYSALLLPKISELVAQNERTIFTFLASSEKYTVNHFIRTCEDEFPIIEPDVIYDYFAPLFKIEAFDSAARKQWQIATSAINKFDEDTQKLPIKIIKTLALIYVVNEFDVISPTPETLYDIYGSSYCPAEIRNALEVIKKEQLLIELSFKPHIKIREGSGNNIDELIRERIAKDSSKFSLKRQLEQGMSSQYIYPAAYNDEQEITRAFKVYFLHAEAFLKINDFAQYVIDLDGCDLNSYRPDGYFFAIVLEDQFIRDDVVRKIQGINNSRVLLSVPKSAKEIKLLAQKHFAIEELINSKPDDTVLSEELTYLRSDLSELLLNYVNTQFLRPEQQISEYYYQGAIVNIQRKSGLSQQFSRICNEIYRNTPKVVNESINKDVITSQTGLARERIITELLKPSWNAKLSLPSNQEISIARSVFVVTGIIEDFESDQIRLNLNVQDARFLNLFGLIRNFILQSASRELSFAELYNTLTNPNLGIGLKKGLIPFYIAASFVAEKRHLVIKFKGREVPLLTRTIIDINDRPNDYTIRLQNWNDEKQQYLNALESIFSRYADISNREYASFDYVVEAMKRWFSNLTQFDRETCCYCSDSLEICEYESRVMQFRKWLNSSDLNASEMLFEKLPNVVGGGYNDVVLFLGETKEKIEANIANHLNRIGFYIKKLFGGKNGASLRSVLKDYYDTLKEETRLQVFNGATACLMEAMRSEIRDEKEIVILLLRGIVGLRIEDFTDKTISSIDDLLQTAKQKIEDFNSAIIRSGDGANNAYVFTYKDGKKEISKRITISSLPSQANLLKNDLHTLLTEEYGESLTSTEKGQILFEILKELCK